jgi:uncharacterized protein (DUF433 family)
MIEAKIVKMGRTPRIEGSRITVFDVLDYLQEGWPHKEIARLFHLSTSRVDVAVRYIEDHKAEVTEEYERIFERSAQGNSPELQAKIDAGRERFLAKVDARRRAESGETRNAGNSRGR